MTLLVWDELQPHAAAAPIPASLWPFFPFFGLLLGVLWGNFVTLGFPLWAGAIALLLVIGGEDFARRLGFERKRPQ